MERSKYFSQYVSCQTRVHISWEAAICEELVTRWGMVAGNDGGEDSHGRAKLRLQSPEELVARAVETTKLLVAALEKNGWAEPITDLDLRRSADTKRYLDRREWKAPKEEVG